MAPGAPGVIVRRTDGYDCCEPTVCSLLVAIDMRSNEHAIGKIDLMIFLFANFRPLLRQKPFRYQVGEQYFIRTVGKAEHIE